jgi:hypothetical protein
MLRSIYGVECNLETAVTAFKALVVGVRENHKLVVFLEIAKRRNRVGKCGPVWNRRAELAVRGVGRIDRPKVGELTVNFCQQLRIRHFRRCRLLRRLVLGEGRQRGVGRERQAARFEKRSKCRKDAGFPIDEGSVTVEG